jgi:hypothetical protein
VLSYVGRAQYLTGDLTPARQTLERSLSLHKGDNVARLYLGLTLARENDRRNGARQMELGMKGISAFLNYITSAFSSGFGQFWDPGHAIRNAIANNLALMAQEGFDWSTVIANGESIGMKIEQEPDLAQQQQNQEIEMQQLR